MESGNEKTGPSEGRRMGLNIPRNVRLAEAPSYGKPIALYDPKSAGARAYEDLAEEILDEDGLGNIQNEIVIKSNKKKK